MDVIGADSKVNVFSIHLKYYFDLAFPWEWTIKTKNQERYSFYVPTFFYQRDIFQ